MNKSAPKVHKYKFVPYGGGVEELDRFAVRDRIRAGEITAATELAPAGSDMWQPAVEFPELLRYFELAAAATLPAAAHTPAQFAAAKPEAEAMRTRIAAGLLYPVVGGQFMLLVGLAVLSSLPLLGILGTLASTLIMVEIVRTSADGRTKMPLVDTTQTWQLVRTYLRVLAVTVISLLPVLAFGAYAFGAVIRGHLRPSTALAGILFALAFAAFYYPACLATIAVWDSVLDALNPVYVVSVVRRVGVDYFIVVAVWFAATAVTTLLSSPLSPLAMIPLFGGVFAKFLSFWSLFYVSHLLGYAVYRHERELGWQ